MTRTHSLALVLTWLALAGVTTYIATVWPVILALACILTVWGVHRAATRYNRPRHAPDRPKKPSAAPVVLDCRPPLYTISGESAEGVPVAAIVWPSGAVDIQAGNRDCPWRQESQGTILARTPDGHAVRVDLVYRQIEPITMAEYKKALDGAAKRV